jgi:hypothetical protein
MRSLLLAPAFAAGAVFAPSAMPPEVVFSLAKLALVFAAAYGLGLLLLRVADALTGGPEDNR